MSLARSLLFRMSPALFNSRSQLMPPPLLPLLPLLLLLLLQMGALFRVAAGLFLARSSHIEGHSVPQNGG